MKPKEAAVGFKSIFKDGGHFCPALLGVQEKRVLGSIPKDIICTWPLGQQTHLTVISGPLSSLFLRKKKLRMQKNGQEKWGHQKWVPLTRE